jgi:hypothetical protein
LVEDYPALIITYVRPEGVHRLLEISHLVGLRRVYIAIDGPRDSDASRKQSEILRVIENFQRSHILEIRVWHRSQNLGAAVSVISAIDWLFKYEGSGFILEDDLIPSTDFFSFAAQALAKYEDDESVWMISGSRMIPTIKGQRESDWSCYPMIWGWATWAARWRTMRETFMQEDPKQGKKFFNARYNFWSIGSRRAKSGLIDAWDLPLAFAQWSRLKFSAIPPVNLVTNVGFDSDATHTSGDVFPLNHPRQSLPSDYFLSERPNLSSSYRYDILLERSLFQIRFRHRALRFYSGLMNKIFHKNKKMGDLSARLTNVVFPE